MLGLRVMLRHVSGRRVSLTGCMRLGDARTTRWTAYTASLCSARCSMAAAPSYVQQCGTSMGPTPCSSTTRRLFHVGCSLRCSRGQGSAPVDGAEPVKKKNKKALAGDDRKHARGPGVLAKREERVSKVIARSVGCSRAAAERVSLDGRVLKHTAPSRRAPDMFILHKLPKELVTRSDPEGRPTIFDRLPAMGLPDNLIAVGRLDYMSEGLLLLTNDGLVARYLELPSSKVRRTYSVRARGRAITHKLVDKLAQGIRIEGFQYQPIHVNVTKKTGGSNYWMDMTLQEGKNQEIRKLLRHFGLYVNRLIRTQYGPYRLGSLPRGAALRVPYLNDVARGVEDMVKREHLERKDDGGTASKNRQRGHRRR